MDTKAIAPLQSRSSRRNSVGDTSASLRSRQCRPRRRMKALSTSMRSKVSSRLPGSWIPAASRTFEKSCVPSSILPLRINCSAAARCISSLSLYSGHVATFK